MQKQKIPLQVQNLTKKFDDFLAVNNISFKLEKGEILGLLGPNGAGKTTTIQMLLGVLTPTKGQIKFWDKSIKNHRESIMEKVNFASTYTNFPWDLTVKETLKFMSYLYKINNREKKIEEVIELFNLEELLKKENKDLSSGQKTRLHLAKAFLNEPDILLLDEPTASLDPDIAESIRRLILKRKQKQNISVLFTSHNMAEIEMVCDRVIFLQKGKIVANDTPRNLSNSIQNIVLEIFISEGLKQAKSILKNNNYKFKDFDKRLNIKIKEENIADVLAHLKDKGVDIIEINIKKPSLEDYFIKLTKE